MISAVMEAAKGLTYRLAWRWMLSSELMSTCGIVALVLNHRLIQYTRAMSERVGAGRSSIVNLLPSLMLYAVLFQV